MFAAAAAFAWASHRVLAEPRPCHDLRSLYPHLLEIAVDHLAQRHPALLSSDGNLLQK